MLIIINKQIELYITDDDFIRKTSNVSLTNLYENELSQRVECSRELELCKGLILQ
jgi:hypothetical protein